MKIYTLLLIFLSFNFARAQEINCPDAKELAKEIVEAELNGAWLPGPSKCQIPTKNIVVNRTQERFSAPIYVACEKVPYQFLEFKEIKKDIFRLLVNIRIASPDGTCKEISPSEIIFRVYKGKSLNFFKNCVGVLSIPQSLVIRKDCMSLENREPQNLTKKK